MKQLFFILCFFLPFTPIKANDSDFPFHSGEELAFDIHYKYGLVMLKAGTAKFKVVNSSYNNNTSYKSTLDFKTTSFFDKIFKMRDTLSSYITEDLVPLYHIRSIHEGSYSFREQLFFNSFSQNYTEVNIKRESRDISKFDTIFTANSKAYDILNLILILCSIDYSQLEFSQSKKFLTFVGRDKINVTARYEGQSIVEKSETLKYRTHKIALDFTDTAFNESKNAIEIWLSADNNRIPIKIRAKLRIGAAEVNLVSWKNLKYPLSSEVKIPPL